MNPHVHLIVAIDRRGGIGKHGDQLFYIREDLRHFKSLTTGNTIVMGRKTFEALPKGALPGRRNIVVTRTPGYVAPGAETAVSLESAIAMATTPVFIIGGAQIYSHALPLAEMLHITVVDAVDTEAEVFFPPLHLADYRIVAVEDAGSAPKATFYTLQKHNTEQIH